MEEYNLDIERLKNQVVEVLETKKAIDVEVIDVAKKTMLAEYFVIASGNTNVQVKALTEDVLLEVEKNVGVNPARIERDSLNRWNLLDYKDIVVHIFHQEDREFYQLEKLWHGPLTIDVVDS
ncbi:MAG: ribosome silencing factor [Clostridiaceae bacterium]|jgi:ribosome-associated protein|nr:ribosome silencing factor [Clostridiaceae bacterium]